MNQFDNFLALDGLVQQGGRSVSDVNAVVRATVDIVVAYLANNKVSHQNISALIDCVSSSLMRSRSPEFQTVEAQARDLAPAPAVPISESITDEYIVCLEDGLKFKSMRRHLSVSYGLSPEEYRARWRLPESYPMVAPVYALRRAAIARQTGLGRWAKPSNEE